MIATITPVSIPVSLPSGSRKAYPGMALRTPVSGAGGLRCGPLLHLFLDQLALQDLAGRVARQLVDEDDLARHLVARQVLPHVALELVLGRLLAALEHHERAQALAEVLVLDSHGRDVAHGGVAGQPVLDLLRA